MLDYNWQLDVRPLIFKLHIGLTSLELLALAEKLRNKDVEAKSQRPIDIKVEDQKINSKNGKLKQKKIAGLETELRGQKL